MNNYKIIIQVLDEPVRIYPVLENFKKRDNILVILSSNDTQTEPILKNENIAYVKKPIDFDNYSESKRVDWILKQVETSYFLLVSTSYFFPESLLKTFDLVSKENKYDGIKTSMYYHSHGKIVQRPFLFKKSTACYFFKKSSIKPEISQIHDEFKLSKDSVFLILKPNSDNSIHVFRDDDMPIITSKHIGYAKREALEYFESSNQTKMTFFKIIYLTIKPFLSGYFRMGGFLAGTEGLLYHFNFTIYKYLVYSHIWELQNNRTFNVNRINHSNDRLKQLGIKQQFNHE